MLVGRSCFGSSKPHCCFTFLFFILKSSKRSSRNIELSCCLRLEASTVGVEIIQVAASVGHPVDLTTRKMMKSQVEQGNQYQRPLHKEKKNAKHRRRKESKGSEASSKRINVRKGTMFMARNGLVTVTGSKKLSCIPHHRWQLSKIDWCSLQEHGECGSYSNVRTTVMLSHKQFQEVAINSSLREGTMVRNLKAMASVAEIKGTQLANRK
ncbi:putative cathepsin L [Sesbania bispinosa]|nr:putative cathepsin L [Sesbania bispinosa]